MLWAGWHLPLFLTSWAGEPGGIGLELTKFTVLAVALSVVITWVFNRAQQSLPLIMLLHATYNNVSTVAWPEFYPGLDTRWSWGPVLAVTAFALLLVLATRGRLGYVPNAEHQALPKRSASCSRR